MHFLDEMLDHFLGDVEIGDNAIAHRPDRFDIARRLAQHQFGFRPDRLDVFASLLDLVRNH